MVAAINLLRSEGFTKMEHMQCLAHNLHNVAKEVRTIYPKLDSLILGNKVKILSRFLFLFRAVYTYVTQGIFNSNN